jgi:glycosyltransferase involved in cell wall biosynthesis
MIRYRPYVNKSFHPLVSIGVPTRNSYSRIRRMLASIWEQDYPNLEVIISDNASEDRTQELCEALSYNNPCIRYYRQPVNIGLVPNFEFVRSHARGEFFMWIADDDRLEPGILKKYVAFLLTHHDYTLVSGQIKYWKNSKTHFCEKDFTMEWSSPAMRALRYYSKVVYGAIFHGLMRRKEAEQIPLRNIIGNDFHFVASLAYLGKIKNLECVGYNKELAGTSSDAKKYARVIGANWFSASFPRLKIAGDAFAEVVFRGTTFQHIFYPTRLLLGVSSAAVVILNYYSKEYPFIVGGILKRSFARLNASMHLSMQKVKHPATGDH